MAVSDLRGGTDIEDVGDFMGARSEPTLAQRLLAAGIPLSLLVDLSEPNGPDSVSICAAEPPDYDLW